MLTLAPVMPYSVGTASPLEVAPFRVDSVIILYRVLSSVKRHGSDCATTEIKIKWERTCNSFLISSHVKLAYSV
jgi:hypothetical protein